MKKIKLLAATLGLCAVAGGLVGCNKDDGTINVGLHLNFGPGAGYSAIQQGYFKDEGLSVSPVMGSGPSLAAQLEENKIQVSFMGGGVAYKYFINNPKIQIVALDNLTDDDRLIASKTGKGGSLTIDSSVSDLAAALKGSSVMLDATATPMTFFKSLVDTINVTFTNDSDKIWFVDPSSESSANYPALTDTASYVETNKVSIVNTSNTNVAQSMQGTSKTDFCVAFAPVSTTLENDTANFTTVAKTSTHMPTQIQPSTWGVNKEWLSTHKEDFQKFMNALVKGMDYRNADPSKCAEDIEKVSNGQVTAVSCNTTNAEWLSSARQLELYANGKMMEYVNNIRTAKKSSNADVFDDSVTAEKAVDFTYLLAACASQQTK